MLPFRLVGDAGPYAAIADALPHELIAELSRLRWLFVTARGSSFRLRAAGCRHRARSAGCSACATACRGTVEVAGTRARRHGRARRYARRAACVWADRFAGALDDVHQIREEIRARILAALEIQIPLHEAQPRAPRGDREPGRLVGLPPRPAAHVPLQPRRTTRRPRALFEQRRRARPGLRPRARRAVVRALPDRVPAPHRRHRRRDRPRPPLRRARPRARSARPVRQLHDGAHASGWRATSTAASAGSSARPSISPNYAQGIYARAWTEALAGRGLEGRAHVDLAMRLSPLDPLYYAMLGTRAFTHMALGEDAEAARVGRAGRALARRPRADRDDRGRGARAGGRRGPRGDVGRQRAGRNAALTREDFFRAFPMKPEATGRGCRMPSRGSGSDDDADSGFRPGSARLVRVAHVRDVDLDHLHHGLHGPLRLDRVRIRQHVDDGGRHHLPGQAELVLEPTALLRDRLLGAADPSSDRLPAGLAQFTTKEIASVNLKCGPPFNAVNGCPSSSKLTTMTEPLGPGPASPYRDRPVIFELRKINV